MVKSIIKRIIVGVAVALILMSLKGSFIANVNAQVYTYNSNNTFFASCTTCGSLTYQMNYDTGQKSSGNILFNARMTSESDANNYTPTLGRATIKINNYDFACFINGISHDKTNTINGITKTISNYSLLCPVSFKNSSIIQEVSIVYSGSGTTNIAIFSPMTFISDDNDELIDSQRSCNIYSKNNIKIDGKFLTSGGVESSSSSWGITNYISLNQSSNIIVKGTQSVNGNLCFYDNDKGLISCTSNSGLNVGDEIAIPNNSSFVRFSINKSTNTPQFEVCSNGNQAIVNSNMQLNDTLNDDNISDSTNSSINGILGSKTEQETFGPVADLILLPLTLFRAFYNGFNNSCSPFNLGTLFNTNITLPCINLRNILGSSLYSIIDVAISLFMLYNIILMCIHIFDKITSFKDPFEELYKPGGDK